VGLMTELPVCGGPPGNGPVAPEPPKLPKTYQYQPGWLSPLHLDDRLRRM